MRGAGDGLEGLQDHIVMRCQGRSATVRSLDLHAQAPPHRESGQDGRIGRSRDAHTPLEDRAQVVHGVGGHSQRALPLGLDSSRSLATFREFLHRSLDDFDH
jgi:hypothetical protein